MLAVPAYGVIPPELAFSLYGAAKGFDGDLLIAAGGCHVDDVRNEIITLFLASECRSLILVDADTRFHPDDLAALQSHDVDVVAGIVPKRVTPEEFAVKFLPGPLQAHNGLLEVAGVGGAFLRISRHCLEVLAERAEKYQNTISGQLYTVPIIFERTLEDGRRWGGDLAFCNKWRRTGGKVYVDPEMTFGHIGENEWTGNLGDWLRRSNGLNDVFIRAKSEHLQPTYRDMRALADAWGNPDWALPPESLVALAMLAPGKTVLELGSGVSTVVLNAFAKQVVSVDENADWAEKMRGFGYDVRHSPIVNGWYSCVPEYTPDLVLIDGPTRSVGDRAKTDITPAPGAVFIVDDADERTLSALSSRYGVQFQQCGRLAIGAAT